MIDQGAHSHVSVISGRIIKSINPLNQYNEFVGFYEECKILRYVQKLGPEFPQNATCDGPLKLSYDYVAGTNVKKYIDQNYPISLQQQKSILYQIIRIYYKLFEVGVTHGDPGLANFIIDENGMIHIIDFGFARVLYRNPIGRYVEPVDDSIFDEDEYYTPEPVEEYHDLPKLQIINNEFTDILGNLVDSLSEQELILSDDLYDVIMDNINDFNKLMTILI